MNHHPHHIRTIAAVVLVALAGLLAACGSSSPRATTAQNAGVKGASEVLAEPTSSTGKNPFMPTVGTDRSGVQPPSAATSSSGGVASYSGGLPGLYGGTRNIATCDAEKMISYLEQNSDKATAWAATLGIRPSQIRDYISGLTPVILRTDTRVTNHGFVNGYADPIQSVLEAGTAVFVDKYGQPVVKCYCGNPLTPPIAYAAPVYTGPIWTGFQTTSITIIERSITIIKIFTLYDPSNGKYFTHPAGIDFSHDGPYTSGTPTPPPTTGSPRTPAPSTGQPSTSGQPAENPSASFSPNPGHQGDTFVLSASGFAPGANVDVTLTRPDGVVEHYSISIGSDGTGSYTFTGTSNVITGTYSATLTNPATGAHAEASVDVQPAAGNTGTSGGSHSGNSGSGTTGSGNSGAGSTGTGSTGAGSGGPGNGGAGSTGAGTTGAGNTGSGNAVPGQTTTSSG
jgi:uncharacterized protein DUF6777